MTKIPRIVHFVFGLKEQLEPFHLMHYLAIESCRQVIQPDKIFLYYHHLPYGEYWDMIRPELTLERVALSKKVEDTHYDETLVPSRYRYAHHADIVRLDVLLERGGIYADIDTLFLRPLPDYLFEKPFVIAREPHYKDELSGQLRPSLCNALMLSAPGASYVRRWRDRIASELNGSWSNHSCFLAHVLAEDYPDEVHVEPGTSFLGVPCSQAGLRAFLEGVGELDTSSSYSLHWWQHLWWEQQRTDFSTVHGGDLTLDHLRQGETPLCKLAQPFLPALELESLGTCPR
ncbi:MAG: glycosyl transferase [Halieaceae bacterium]|jgi:hypothetical protein|nr:glycosyl transferase [Halieaceae bacterium]